MSSEEDLHNQALIETASSEDNIRRENVETNPTQEIESSVRRLQLNFDSESQLQMGNPGVAAHRYLQGYADPRQAIIAQEYLRTVGPPEVPSNASSRVTSDESDAEEDNRTQQASTLVDSGNTGRVQSASDDYLDQLTGPSDEDVEVPFADVLNPNERWRLIREQEIADQRALYGDSSFLGYDPWLQMSLGIEDEWSVDSRTRRFFSHAEVLGYAPDSHGDLFVTREQYDSIVDSVNLETAPNVTPELLAQARQLWFNAGLSREDEFPTLRIVARVRWGSFPQQPVTSSEDSTRSDIVVDPSRPPGPTVLYDQPALLPIGSLPGAWADSSGLDSTTTDSAVSSTVSTSSQPGQRIVVQADAELSRRGNHGQAPVMIQQQLSGRINPVELKPGYHLMVPSPTLSLGTTFLLCYSELSPFYIGRVIICADLPDNNSAFPGSLDVAQSFASALHSGVFRGEQVLELFSRVNNFAHRMIFCHGAVHPRLNTIVDSDEGFDYLVTKYFPCYAQIRSMFHYRSHSGHRCLTLAINVSEPGTKDQRPTLDFIVSFMDIARMWLITRRPPQ